MPVKREPWKQRHYDCHKLFARLFKHRIIDPVTSCWLWPFVNDSGYGQLHFDHHGRKFSFRIHRIAAWLYLGYDGATNLEVCHSCNVKACFNPSHLYLASHQQNIRDARRDGLFPKKFRSMKRLSIAEVRLIRARAKSGDTHAALAREFNVTPGCVAQLVARQTWKHVTDEPLH